MLRASALIARKGWGRICGILFAVSSSMFLLLFNSACATVAARDSEIAPLLRIGYSPGGDAPVVTVMEVYETYIRLGELGGRMSKKSVSSSELLSVRRELATGMLAELQTSPGVGRHERELWIEYDGPGIGILLEDPPLRLIPLLRALKELFSQEFGARFDHVAIYIP